jgi:filamentous hemagglutinin
MESADPGEFIRNRVAQLASAIPARSRGRITMAVGVAEDGAGTRAVLVATSEPRRYLRPGVTIEGDEVLVPGSGHAEQNIVDYVTARGWTLIGVGATRPICPRCASAIRVAGGIVETTIRR